LKRFTEKKSGISAVARGPSTYFPLDSEEGMYPQVGRKGFSGRGKDLVEPSCAKGKVR